MTSDEETQEISPVSDNSPKKKERIQTPVSDNSPKKKERIQKLQKYTFYTIQKNTREIVSRLESGKNILPFKRKKRFKLYDKILLDVLNKKEISASDVFRILFQKNNVLSLLSFLNEESAIVEDLAIINSVPKKAFIRSALRKLF